MGSKRIGVSICDEKEKLQRHMKLLINQKIILISRVKEIILENNIKGNYCWISIKYGWIRRLLQHNQLKIK